MPNAIVVTSSAGESIAVHGDLVHDGPAQCTLKLPRQPVPQWAVPGTVLESLEAGHGRRMVRVAAADPRTTTLDITLQLAAFADLLPPP